MEKTNYSVARVQTYTRASILKAERHNERKNTTYSNMNVDLAQTQNNMHYKKCDGTYNERLKEMIDTGDVSLRGLKDNAKIFDEIIKAKDHYRCSSYKHDTSACTSHYISDEVLQIIVLENIQRVVSYMKDYEDLFIKEQLAKSTQDEIKKITKCKKELEKAKNRVIEIDSLFMHIYEDNVSGKISDDRFKILSFNYDKEQQKLKLKIEQLSKDIENTEKKDTDVTSFISNVKKYTEITHLTAEILNELIEKIVIHQQEKIDGKKTQEIGIYYRGVGIISFTISINDIEITINKILNRKTA